MADRRLVRRLLFRTPGGAAAALSALVAPQSRSHSTRAASPAEGERGGAGRGGDRVRGDWLTLPPFDRAVVDGAALGRELSRGGSAEPGEAATMTALKWVLRCCPELPRSLVQKLFRLRQVRREFLEGGLSDVGTQMVDCRLKRVAAKDSINLGDRIYLPISVKELPSKKQECRCNSEEVNFVRGIVLHKDDAIIAVNKPPGMPVQGGVGISRSFDEVAITCLKYDHQENPRLVHRLDKDCSGILVMGRTQTSATFLHSLFREKTVGALNNDSASRKRLLQRKYWALVIGSPRRSKGVISAPLGKVLMDNGKSDRITIINGSQTIPSYHAITEYEVIESRHGYTWLQLSPLTGRKHQLRVHCAEALGTPIVGDYKYGWQAHRNFKNWQVSNSEESFSRKLKGRALPFGLDLDNGSISDERPRLHLHSNQVLFPNIALALQNMQLSSGYDLSELETLELVAPLPPYMQKSLDFLK
ncbi:hypothetical protein ACJRO7_027437 [Eucalyptus globulus]|uniref:Pseudouridine synthase RsuA/RluA-like domain-containing protein n=1 Tax=Eucalyptus globulus TaxID=34317 RepID=A0ABD3JVW6_EUCGL